MQEDKNFAKHWLLGRVMVVDTATEDVVSHYHNRSTFCQMVGNAPKTWLFRDIVKVGQAVCQHVSVYNN